MTRTVTRFLDATAVDCGCVVLDQPEHVEEAGRITPNSMPGQGRSGCG